MHAVAGLCPLMQEESMKSKFVSFILSMPFLTITTLSFANVDQLKVYREVNPGDKK